MNTVHDLLEMALKAQASDVIVKAGSPPIFRVNGVITPASVPALSVQQAEQIVHSLEAAAQRERLLSAEDPLTEQEILKLTLGEEEPAYGDLEENIEEKDYVFSIPDLARVRANVYLQHGTPAAAIRIIPLAPLTIDELELPASLKDLALQPRGLILVTGPTGSGKSTTLAAMIEHINRNDERNILTIEDPVEFVFQDKRSVIQQREVGRDTPSFTSALNAAMRQTPDVLMVGEMRSLEAMEAVLAAAEVGHLVLSTLHTTSAPAAVDRILNSFPPDRRPQVVSQLTATLTGIVAQRLVRRSDQEGRVAAVETLTASPTVLKLIEEGNTGDLTNALREGSHYGMASMNQSLERLYRQGKISEEEALANSPHPQELRQLFRHG
ncbi:MAG: PilT/PilU family type 4a pilus ATPase [Armatimonadetes bacterium]|nr:PilT/PilU family type 4a pilus ATPase [Armatimonadota bacterium]